jgi:subtilisin family serine protease
MSKAFLTKFVIVIGVFATLSLGSCKKNLDNTASDPNLTSPTLSTSLTDNQDFVAGELIVKFNSGKSDKEKNNALARIGGKMHEKILTKAMKDDGDTEGIVVVNTSLDVLDAVGKIKGPEIEYAEPNYIYRHEVVTNDPYFSSLWGMIATNTYSTQAETAWGKGQIGSPSVVVGVIDEGIQFEHPDLVGQIWTNPLDPIDGIDNDGDGYKDDIHGWDFANNDNTIYDGGTGGTQDTHGTHVAGTIGALGNNGLGVVGMNWNITIISAKFLSPSGGTTANAVKAIDYFVFLKNHGVNIVALNNSWGGGGYTKSLFDAITRANVAGILFIAAAGNGDFRGVAINNDKKPTYPASYAVANVISVAAIDATGKLASWSNYGAKTVHLAAPGVAIWSTMAYNTYASWSGTSMATPHVTGAVALYASIHPGSSAAVIKAAILAGVKKDSYLTGKTVTGGCLNVSGF